MIQVNFKIILIKKNHTMILSSEKFFVTFLFPAFFKIHGKCAVRETMEGRGGER